MANLSYGFDHLKGAYHAQWSIEKVETWAMPYFSTP